MGAIGHFGLDTIKVGRVWVAKRGCATVGVGLGVNASPNDTVLCAGGDRGSDGKHDPADKSETEEAEDLDALGRVWEVGRSPGPIVGSPGVVVVVSLSPVGERVRDDNGSRVLVAS